MRLRQIMYNLTIAFPKNNFGSYVLRCAEHLQVFELGAVFVYSTFVQVRCNYKNIQHRVHLHT